MKSEKGELWEVGGVTEGLTQILSNTWTLEFKLFILGFIF